MIASEVIRYGFATTSITALAVALSAAGVATIAIREHPDDEAFLALLRRRFPGADLRLDKNATRAAIDSVVNFVERPKANLSLPLDIRGTEFQRRVWAAVLKVPFGETTTYTAIAAAIDQPKAMHAVGNACTRSPLEFAIPCHRVLRSDGRFSGGGEWGDRRQATIVQREAAAAALAPGNHG